MIRVKKKNKVNKKFGRVKSGIRISFLAFCQKKLGEQHRFV